LPRSGKFSASAFPTLRAVRAGVLNKGLTRVPRGGVVAPRGLAYDARRNGGEITMQPSNAAPLPALDHEAFLRRSFDVARKAREGGDHPFGSILVGPDRAILREQGNGFSAEGGDMTAHAERLLATWASKTLSPEVLAGSTLYTSAEPCAMCAGAIYWAGIGRVVYGQSEKDLKALTGAHAENPTLDLPCRAVFAAGQRAVEVVGPLLEDEAAALQRDFWAEKKARP